MKIELMHNSEGKRVGFKLIRETTDDIATVEQVRDMLFWGMGDEALDYNGRTADKSTDETIELRFATKAHRDEERKKMEEDVKKLISLKQMPQEIREQFD